MYRQDIAKKSLDTIIPDLAESRAWNGDKTKLTVPPMVSAVPRLSTNQVPVTLDDSLLGNDDESNDFVGEWRHLYVGMRTQIGITVLRERYADLGQVGFWAWMRADVQLAQPAAFDVVTDIRP